MPRPIACAGCCQQHGAAGALGGGAHNTRDWRSILCNIHPDLGNHLQVVCQQHGAADVQSVERSTVQAICIRCCSEINLVTGKLQEYINVRTNAQVVASNMEQLARKALDRVAASADDLRIAAWQADHDARDQARLALRQRPCQTSMVPAVTCMRTKAHKR